MDGSASPCPLSARGLNENHIRRLLSLELLGMFTITSRGHPIPVRGKDLLNIPAGRLGQFSDHG
jgi:hypothetical protein